MHSVLDGNGPCLIHWCMTFARGRQQAKQNRSRPLTSLASSPVPHYSPSTDIIFVVNNFANAPQAESSRQPARPASDFNSLSPAITQANATGAVFALADVRYSNGGDLAAVAWLQTVLASERIAVPRLAYAGWNTDGNTLGTVAANAVLLARFTAARAAGRDPAAAANRRFTLLRVTEDALYQASVRTALNVYVPAAGESITDLSGDLGFYERYSFKPLHAQSGPWAISLGISDTVLARAYYPWNRTFEIGLELSSATATHINQHP